MTKQKEWWQKAVCYQIYPRSYKDSTNNGKGDLRGIINKLPYLKDLGIDAIWFSPFFPSPQADFGYDVSDYCAINPEYGTMDDFDELLEKAHKAEIKIILDIVLNHTSEQHSWFQESKRNRTNEKHDWYVWMDGRGRNGKKPPNNWRAIVGGSAWTWSDTREQFYLHQFLPCQPDLNWRNPEVRETMFDCLRFWLDKGVDGFRLDIIHTLFEDKDFQDNPASFILLPGQKTNKALFQNPINAQFLPETIETCKQLRKIADSYNPPRMLVGEALGPPTLYRQLCGDQADGLHMVFNFHLGHQPFRAKAMKKAIQLAEKTLPDPLWPCNVFSNHDVVRMITRYGNDPRKARLITLLLLTMRGTPFIYYGEEIGMQQVKVPRKQQKDPICFHSVWGIPVGFLFGRDGCRTPMQWNDSPVNAGFSNDSLIEPWLPIGPNNDTNVANQQVNEHSMLNFYRRLVKLRKKHLSLQIGKLQLSPKKTNRLLAYERMTDKESILIVLNFSRRKTKIQIPYKKALVLFSTLKAEVVTNKKSDLTLLPFEGKIIIKQNK
jgi:oligo-1,6-glucosidase/alpha-glucosidase